MRRFYCLWLLTFLLMEGLSAGERVVRLKIVETTDVHGNYYPYDFIGQRDAAGSLARVYDFVQKERRTYGDNLILLDNGDFLQGQPSAYYYNYMDTVAPHLGAEMLNFMGYDAASVGNHDIETGRVVFDRWAGDCDFPVLGANVVETATGKPHFKPYVVLEREGVRIAVLGMITPAIPMWLSENLWQGLRFDDMEETARKWMKVIREEERADVVVGLFHAGKEAYVMGGKYRENASVDVARRVPGFDVVLMGHDHVYTRTYMMNGVTPDTSNGVQSEVTDPDGVLYLTANSASGSKYYDIKAPEAAFSAVMDQSYRRTVTEIDVTDTSYTMTTYYADDMTVLDKFTINKTSDVDTSALDALIDEAQGLNQADYPADLWAEFEAAYSAAVNFEANMDTTQADVDAVYADLKAAMDKLAASLPGGDDGNKDDPDDDGNQGNTGDSGNDGNQGNAGNTGNNGNSSSADKGGSSKGNIPKTGDTVTAVPAVIMLGAAGCAVILLLRRRKAN